MQRQSGKGIIKQECIYLPIIIIVFASQIIQEMQEYKNEIQNRWIKYSKNPLGVQKVPKLSDVNIGVELHYFWVDPGWQGSGFVWTVDAEEGGQRGLV